MKAQTVRLDRWGEFLGSRLLGETIRSEVEALLQQTDTVMIDCEGIGMMSHSFADELFGKLVLALGFETFRKRIKLSHVNDSVASLLRFVIANRRPHALPDKHPQVTSTR